MNRTFWHGKRVFVTGHTGFKGSWLSLWLQSLGAEVTGYALEPPTEPSLFRLAAVAEGMASQLGDIRDAERLRRSMSSAKPEIVFHLAAQAIVGESYNNPVDTYATNVMGTVHLLDTVRQVGGVRAVVGVTSDKCYENREWIWGYRENEPLGGYDPYSSSKGCAELVYAAYRRSYFNPCEYGRHGVAVATARAGNVIGGGDWATNRLVPDLLDGILNGRTVLVRNPRAMRPWQHVLEALNGYLTLAEQLYTRGPSVADAWNFGPDQSDVRSVAWVADRLVNLCGHGASWKQDERHQPHEDLLLMVDSTKARHRLNWKPVLSLDAALRWTVEWARAFQAGAEMRRVTQSQIDRFTALLTAAQIRSLAEARPSASTVVGRPTPGGVLARVFDSMNDTVITRGIDGQIASWNKGAEKLYGWTRHEALGQVSHVILQTQFPASFDDIHADFVRNGYWEGRLVHVRRDGTRIHVNSRWALQHDEVSRPDAVVEINSLLTERRTAQERGPVDDWPASVDDDSRSRQDRFLMVLTLASHWPWELLVA